MERTPDDKPAASVAAPDFGHAADPFGELAAVLWHEQELLERLLYCLTTQRLVLESSGGRWLAAADRFVAIAAHALREHELLRAVTTESLLAELELPRCSSLCTIAAHADEPWPSIFADLQAAMSRLTDEIDGVIVASEQVLLTSLATAGDVSAPPCAANCAPVAAGQPWPPERQPAAEDIR